MTDLNIPEAVEASRRLIGEWETQGWPDTPELGADLAEKLRQLIALASLVERLTEALDEAADGVDNERFAKQLKRKVAEARAALKGRE